MNSADKTIDRILTLLEPVGWEDREPDYEAMWEARQDPEGDLDRMEDAYDNNRY